jgi:hypothetical protein
MRVQDFICTTAPPPDELQKARSGAEQSGVDLLTGGYIHSGDHCAPAPQKRPIIAAVAT